MRYNFICKNGHIKEITCKMGEIKNKKIICDDCGEPMHQQWTTSFKVPEGMKAGDIQQMAWVNDRLKNRPSGKRKVIY